MTVTAGGIEFDSVFYDREADVLYLHVGDPASAFDATPEGYHLRYGSDEELVGITIVHARRVLQKDGKITVTLPGERVEIQDLGDLLAAA